MSRGSESPPFEAESQEGQLPSFRTEVRSFAATGGAPPFLPAFAGPAGCGDPAVGGEDGTVNCKTIKDIGRAMSQEEIDKYVDKAAFGKTSLLWRALAKETDIPGSVWERASYLPSLFSTLSTCMKPPVLTKI